MTSSFKQHRRQMHAPTPTAHQHECLVHHCEQNVPPTHGFQLCERHLAKAWAAYELAHGRPEVPNAPEETVDLHDWDTPGAVYIIRKGDLLKIGWTNNVAERFRKLQPDAVLHVEAGTREDEHGYHQRFKHHAARGREWFHLNDDTTRILEELQLCKTT